MKKKKKKLRWGTRYREPESLDISTGKIMENKKLSSGLWGFVIRQEAEEKDGQRMRLRADRRVGARHEDWKSESCWAKRVGELV